MQNSGCRILILLENPQFAKSVLAKYTKETDAVMLDKTYDFFTKQAGFNRDLTFTDRGFEQILKFMGGTILPAAKDATPSQFYDTKDCVRSRTGEKRESLEHMLFVVMRRAIHRDIDVVIPDTQTHDSALNAIAYRDSGYDHAAFAGSNLQGST